jgi:hypothetical protein
LKVGGAVGQVFEASVRKAEAVVSCAHNLAS